MQELYARILKVEGLIDRVKDFGGVDLSDVYESVSSMSQSVSRRLSGAQSLQLLGFNAN